MNTHRVVAFSSAVAFAAQVLFALLMLRLFSPQEVGEFSVISQIGFFWMTLALAQSQLGVLANQHISAHIAAQQAWRASALRGLGLLPVAALAVWFSQLSLWPALLWALLLAFCQMGWMLAQSLTLRTGSAGHQAAVRVLPPLTAATAALIAVLFSTSIGWGGPTLLLCALLGYAVGAAWLVPALRGQSQINTQPHSSSDPRSATLRMTHTLVDALLATALILVWQRLYGAEETGWMSALLRVLGFVPAVVHVAWAQVVLAKGRHDKQNTAITNPWWVGWGAFVAVMSLGAACALALTHGWLDEKWHGVLPYIWPLVIWQGSACLSAAFSHLPFLNQHARDYSILCITGACIQMCLLTLPLWLNMPISANQFIQLFAIYSALYLLLLTIWLSRRPALMDDQSTPK